MPHVEKILGLAGYEIKRIHDGMPVVIEARYTGPARCPWCDGEDLRIKALFTRKVRHGDVGNRHCYLWLESRKYRCLRCSRYFNQRFPSILPRKRSTEPFRRSVYQQHMDGISRKVLASRERIGTATIERWAHDFLKLELKKLTGRSCPKIMGIDEHFFSRRDGYATTLCDLRNHSVFDVVLGRSEVALDTYFQRLEGKSGVKVVCMDLASNYRALVEKYFPQAMIVADRFHVIRLVNQHFLAAWRMFDAEGSRNRGLLSLMRRHEDRLSPDQKRRLACYLRDRPHLQAIYDFKQRLCRLLRQKTCTARECRRLIPQLLESIETLTTCGVEALERLGKTLRAWQDEIMRMWRFSKNNGITEGFHTKMELLSRQAYGYRNFDNYRLRVRVLCA